MDTFGILPYSLLAGIMSDWPDPRLPERNISRIEIAVVSVVVIVPAILFIWGLLEPIIRSNWPG